MNPFHRSFFNGTPTSKNYKDIFELLESILYLIFEIYKNEYVNVA